MEPKKFCEPCDYGYRASNNCLFRDFYPKKGYCPISFIEGIPAHLDCFNIHIENKSILREDKSALVLIIKEQKTKQNKKCFFVNPFLGEFYNRNI